MDEHLAKQLKFSSQCIHGYGDTDPMTGAVTVPIYQTSTFAFSNCREGADTFSGERDGYVYTRIGNPTVAALEERIALLEGGESAIAFSSGMAAISSLFLAFASTGDNIVASDTVYGGTYDLFHETLPRLGIEIREVNATDINKIEDAIDSKTRFIFIETPANPSLSIIDIKACSEIARQRNLHLVVDNTFATPYFQKPLDLGADFVIHSASKYIGGHSDVIAGITVGPKAFIQEIRNSTNKNLGPTMSPFNAWLLIRGLKTLPVRMKQHEANSMAVARFLEKHPRIEKVWYPGLPSHPQYALAAQQMSGFSGMVSFEVSGGRDNGEKFIDSLRLIILAVSLGGVDSLIEHPASMTHSGYTREDLHAAGISEGLVRLSVGLEDETDLISDLSQALDIM